MVFAVICAAMLLIIQPVLSADMKKTSDKYGPYYIASAELEICRGPKSVDQAVIPAASIKNEGDVIIANFSYNVTEATKMDEIKITVYNIKNNKKNLMWNYKMTNPCKHFAVGAILADKLHMKSENCILKVGIYDFDINISEAVHAFYGHSFFYGDYIFKLISVSKKGNLGCMIMHQVFEKKV